MKMTTPNTRFSHSLSLLLPLLLTMLTGSALAQSEAPTHARPGAARPGWYLGLGSGGARLDLDDSVEARFAALDMDLSRTGQGGSLFVGYCFDNRFNLELNLDGQSPSTGRSDIDATYFSFEIVGMAPLMPEARVSPYLLGSLGGGGLAFTGDGIDDKVLLAAQTGVGAGAEVALSRRFSLDFDYRIALQHYQQEVLDLRTGGEQTVDFEGSGVLQRWGLRVVFSF